VAECRGQSPRAQSEHTDQSNGGSDRDELEVSLKVEAVAPGREERSGGLVAGNVGLGDLRGRPSEKK
jgi:hypothetical protein